MCLIGLLLIMHSSENEVDTTEVGVTHLCAILAIQGAGKRETIV